MWDNVPRWCYVVHMTTKPPARESRSVRLRESEWIVAEAIARHTGETSAGSGIRAALLITANRIRKSGNAPEFNQLIEQITAERGR